MIKDSPQKKFPGKDDSQKKRQEEQYPIEVKIVEREKPKIATIRINKPTEINDSPSVRIGEIKIISNSKEAENINALKIGNITIK